jgi:glycosyltransferase involved in cell wall biosynthesis
VPGAEILSVGTWQALTGHQVLQVCHPDWRGVRAATYGFEDPVVETADASESALRIVDGARETGIETIVVQGFPPGSADLLLAATRAGLRTRCVLHSSPAQHGAERGEAFVAEQVLSLAGEGVIGQIGFVKEGLAEMFAALGYESRWVPNRMPKLSEIKTTELAGQRPHIGVLAESFWRKNVVTQLGAVAIIGGTGHVMHRPEVDYLSSLPLVEHGTLPWEDFVGLLGSMDLNLYSTLSECHPLTPMESYLAGVPCLFSRTSALFADDPRLLEISTLAEADNPAAIARAATRLLENRSEVVPLAQAWMVRFDRLAAEHWVSFTRGT